MQPTAPHWSIMITSYNRPYVAQAIRSVLAQDQGPDHMHIEVVDDHSTALDIESLVRAESQGRVAFHRNPQNLGLYENWNHCIRRAQGEWLHILHDDDLVYPGFYRSLEAAAQSAPTIAAAFCSTQLIDADNRPFSNPSFERPWAGIFPDLLRRLLSGNCIQFPAIAVRRSVYEQLGGFNPAIDYVADWDMWMRLAAQHPIWYEPQLLAAYRIHPGSETSALQRSGRERRGYTRAADLWLQYAGPTPENIALQTRQKEIFATESLNLAAASFTRNDFYAGLHQLLAALDCSTAPAVLRALPPLLSHILTAAPLTPETRRQLLDQFHPHSHLPFQNNLAVWRPILAFIAKNTPS